MSGIAKPLVKFSTAIDPTIVVSADYISDISKLDVGQLPNQPANTATFGISIDYILPNGHTKNKVVNFATDILRDAAFTAFETLVAATI